MAPEKNNRLLATEGTENTEIYNLCFNKISEWFDETFAKLKTSKKDECDLVIAGILLACRKYSLATVDLIKNKHIIPAQALLRILLEIFATTVWCIKPHKPENDKKQQVHNRFMRWDFLRIKEHKKLLDVLNSGQPEHINAIKELEKQINIYQNDGVKCLPPKRTIFEELGKDWMLIYAKFYQYYNRAIHLDMNIVRGELVSYDSSKNAILYKYDFEECDELGDLLSMSRDINTSIRQFYGWDDKHLKEEYQNIIKKIEK
jgi:hypothetical protein